MEQVRAGSEVYIEVSVKDLLQQPPALFDPSGGVQVTLKDPSGAIIVSNGSMSKQSVGVYTYRHQSGINDSLGTWPMEFQAIHGSATHLSMELGAFELVAK